MKKFKFSVVALLLSLTAISIFAQKKQNDLDKLEPCYQDKDEKFQLIKKAEDNEFRIRRIYFVGNTFTRDRTFRENTKDAFNEGYIFTQKSLTESIKGINKLKTIKPITLDNVSVRLAGDENRDLNVIDFDICIQETKRFLSEEQKADLNKLIKEAEANQYNVRRIEIVGSLTTNYRIYAKKMAFNEGDIFTKANLEKSIRNVSRLKEIYPIELNNVEASLDRENKEIDLIFYVVEKN